MEHYRETIEITSEAEWLALREKDVTSTETAALFGCSPYMTEYELWHRKTGQLVVEFETNDRVKWGNRLEAAIAYGIAEDLGLIVEPFKVYMRLSDMRMGSSFDFRIVGLAENYTGDETYRDLFREHGDGIMEVKNVDGLQFRRGWIADGDDMEAPPHIELQVQHQLEVAGLQWAVIAPLVGGNTPSPFYRLRNFDYGNAITEKVCEFWQSIEDGKAPSPDFTQDGKTIAQLLANDNGETVDMSDNERLAELVAEHMDASIAEKEASQRKDAAKAEILTLIGTNAKVMLTGRYINAGTTKDSAGTLITPEMVGTRVGARKGYRQMRIYATKAK